ncbi:MAG: response regulator [Myxococcaceae bacterium]|nr:response regulator [Myxococcaceae bacterium]
MTRVLLVDDETDLADLMASQLTRAGFEVRCADALLSAEAANLETKFDVLVTDLHLPDGDGVDVARSLKIPICLALTGSSVEADAKRLISEGFAMVLVKPVTSARLVAAIHDAVAAAAARPIG